jgi:hypothetical protein
MYSHLAARSMPGELMLDRAIAQTVSRRLPTAATRVRARFMSCGVYGGQSGTAAGFLRVLGLPSQLFHRLLHTHHPSSSRAGINRPVSSSLSNSVIVDSVPLHPKEEKLLLA